VYYHCGIGSECSVATVTFNRSFQMQNLMLKPVSNVSFEKTRLRLHYPGCWYFRSASGRFCKRFAASDDRDTPATQTPISFPLHHRSPGIRLDVLSSGDVLMISPMWIHRIHRPHTGCGQRNHRNAVAMPAARKTLVCNANNTPHYSLSDKTKWAAVIGLVYPPHHQNQ
jgi:hypothetical protein